LREALIAVGSLAIGSLVVHVYYRKASTTVPDWFKPILPLLSTTLPIDQLSKAQLLDRFQAALERVEIRPDLLTGHVACPTCRAPASDFNHEVRSLNDVRSVAIVSSPHCGWTEHSEV
jgi:hypothetical protein